MAHSWYRKAVGIAATSMVIFAGGAGLAPPAHAGAAPGYPYGHAIRDLAGCEASALAGNDDGYVPDAQPLGFQVNFFGVPYTEAFVNNNGNVTFDQPRSDYVPFDLFTTTIPIIAPFFSDVDTRGPGRTVHYGSGTTDTGQKYFCVDWIEVGEYPAHAPLDSFQLVLFDDSAQPGGHAGQFTIEFNYDSMLWDHGGSSVAGFAAGTGQPGSALVLDGSGTPGALLDGGSKALNAGNANSPSQDGRYRFPVHNTTLPTGTVTGVVTTDGGDAVQHGQVQLCTSVGAFCRQVQTDTLGGYSVLGLADGTYTVTAYPPVGSGGLQATEQAAVTSANGHHGVADIVLTVPHPLPPGTTVGDQNGTTDVGGVTVPVIHWGIPHPVTITACPGATAATLTADGENVYTGQPYHQVFTLVEDPLHPGMYTATLPEFDTLGIHGPLVLTVSYLCPGSGTPTTPPPFTVYIDPSGTILSGGAPLQGATVTLYRSDDAAGPFTIVPDGSDVMSPLNRNNPQLTPADGSYGWDVQSGFYMVRAAKAGCTGPGGAAYVDSAILTIPPAVTGLDLSLDCGTAPTPPTIVCPAAVTTIVGATPAVLGVPVTTGLGVTVTNDAPAAIPPGVSTVTWQAANTAGTVSCAQRVTSHYTFSGLAIRSSSPTTLVVAWQARRADGSVVTPPRYIASIDFGQVPDPSRGPGATRPLRLPVVLTYDRATHSTVATFTLPPGFSSTGHRMTLILGDGSVHSLRIPAV